jgi:pimeloyl-ACP methyl ester carboxylesterase
MVRFTPYMKIIATIGIFYLAYALLVFLLQRSLLFPGQYIPASTSGVQHLGYEQVWLQTSYGSVEAWYLPAPGDGKRPAVICAHGNYELLEHFFPDLLPFRNLGVDVLAVEFPGYGRSEGSPSEDSIIEAFTAAYDWLLKQEDIDEERIFAYGRSVGGGAVCSLVVRRALSALIVQSTFTDVRQFAWRYLVPPFLARDPFDNLRAVELFEGPVLIFHGRYDKIIPYRNAVALSRKAHKAVLVTYDCHHNDCPPDANAHWRRIRAFLSNNNIITVRTSR